MRAVVIRVSRASITINGEAGGSMDKGFVVLVGVNFLIEFGANLILSPAIASIVKAFQKMK